MEQMAHKPNGKEGQAVQPLLIPDLPGVRTIDNFDPDGRGGNMRSNRAHRPGHGQRLTKNESTTTIFSGDLRVGEGGVADMKSRAAGDRD